METDIIKTITDYYNGNVQVKTVIINNKVLKNIQHDYHKNILERVYTEGVNDSTITRIVVFAYKTEQELVINKLFCTENEIKRIKSELNTPFIFTKIGMQEYEQMCVTQF